MGEQWQIRLSNKAEKQYEKLNQKEFSARTGISQDNISKIENGKRPVGEKTAKKLAAVLKTDYRVFLSSSENLRK